MREDVVDDAGLKEDAHAKVSVPVPNNASNRSAKRSPRSIFGLCVPTKASHQTLNNLLFDVSRSYAYLNNELAASKLADVLTTWATL
jgi:hypothetical protein